MHRFFTVSFYSQTLNTVSKVNYISADRAYQEFRSLQKQIKCIKSTFFLPLPQKIIAEKCEKGVKCAAISLELAVGKEPTLTGFDKSSCILL